MTTEKSESKPGRPTKLTPLVRKCLLEAIAQGVSYKAACRLAHIHFDTFNQWRKENSEFFDQVEESNAKAVQGAVQCLQRAITKGDWRAAVWFLERRCPERYSSPEVILRARHAQEKDATDEIVRAIEFWEPDSDDEEGKVVFV